MWLYRVRIKNDKGFHDIVLYKSKSPKFNLNALISRNHRREYGNFTTYEDNSMSWCNDRGYFAFNDKYHLLDNIVEIQIIREVK